MSAPIRIGILGHGNLGRGVELAIGKNPDMALAGIFSRRDPATITPAVAGTPVFPAAALLPARTDIDVLILCGGSRQDLPEQSPHHAAHYHVVDSFDTHARIPGHFAAVDAAAAGSGHLALIAAGWDPGLFSLQRVLAEAVLPEGRTHTFWGRGLSQGHSDAIRRVPGVAAGVQYTIPSETAMARARAGADAGSAAGESHERECFVVLEPGADPEAVRAAIVGMPDYFAPYRTRVHFISADELAREHGAMPHGGVVIRSGRTRAGVDQRIEYQLQLDSNPEFTASVLVACARAVHRLARAGRQGAHTVFDLPIGLFSPHSAEDLRKNYL